MLSDTLLESLAQIERHQREFPDCYDGIADWIGSVKTAMRDLSGHLDSRSPMHTPKFERIDGEFGHYISGYGMGVVHCIVSRHLTTIHEACAERLLFSFQINVPVSLDFRITTEGLAREALVMAEKLRQMADASPQETDAEPRQHGGLDPSVSASVSDLASGLSR